MSLRLGLSKNRTSEMNVVPLIDVLLVLLIIFMTLPHNFGERAGIPHSKRDPTILRPEAPLVIQLGDNGFGSVPTIKINHDQVTWDSLENKLQDIYEGRIERELFLKGDPEIDFQYVAQVVDVAHHAGVDHVGLLGASE